MYLSTYASVTQLKATSSNNNNDDNDDDDYDDDDEDEEDNDDDDTLTINTEVSQERLQPVILPLIGLVTAVY